jgi:chromosomal replication initiator protein
MESQPEGTIEPLLDFQIVPLVVHAPSGYGKSCLLAALAATWSRQHSAARVLLTTGADFARAYAASQKLDDLPRFLQRYQRADLMLIDDLQQLQRKSGAQRGLASILDHRQRHDRPTVLAAAQPLRLLSLAPRLISRLASGLVIPLELPSPLTRSAILQEMCDERRASMSAEAMELLVQHEPVTVPQLVGLVHQLGRSIATDSGRESVLRETVSHKTAADTHPSDHHAGSRAETCGDRSQESDVEITAGEVKRLLAEWLDEPVEARDVIRSTASFFGLGNSNLTGTSRRKLDVLARSIAMHLIRSLTDLSFQQIGQSFGNRDHTTVMHACKKIAAQCQTDTTTRNAVREIGRRLKTSSQARQSYPPNRRSRTVCPDAVP